MKWLFQLSILVLAVFTCKTSANETQSQSHDANAEDTAVIQVDSWFEDFLEKLGADGEFDPTKPIDFSYLPGPFYNPEYELGLGLSAVGLYQVGEPGESNPMSSLVINGLVSTTGAFGVSVTNNTHYDNDNQRFYARLELFNIPEVYYGVGYELNRDDDNKVDYDSRQFRITPMWQKRILPNSFAGIGLDYSYVDTRNIDINESDIDVEDLSESSRNMGINAMINYDTRDSTLRAENGVLAQIDLGVYRKSFGSKTNFEVLDMLYSQYMPIMQDDVLAWQVRGRFTHGDVPWDRLSRIGGDDLIRGYTSGRYRDEQMLLAQVEYRQNLTGRHGMVYWAGAGVLSDEVNELLNSDILPTVGLGYRFEVKPKVNLRLDLAFGDGETGFYFNVNEAF